MTLHVTRCCNEPDTGRSVKCCQLRLTLRVVQYRDSILPVGLRISHYGYPPVNADLLDRDIGSMDRYTSSYQ